MPYLSVVEMGANDILLTNEDLKSLHHIIDYSFLLRFATLNPFLKDSEPNTLINIVTDFNHMKMLENID
jgi:hypothetical protein